MTKLGKRTILIAAAICLMASLSSRGAFAQTGSMNDRHPHQPWSAAMPPGIAGNWAAIIGRSGTLLPGQPGYFQPVSVELPSEGLVTFYDQSPERPISLTAPAQAELVLGHTYRLKITGMPEYPGVEIYPTVEVIDRLHPPEGQKQHFPVPVQLTRQEIEFALEGRLVTKVVYLERPQTAVPHTLESPLPVDTVPARSNLFVEVNGRGRAMLILRLGGRVPDFRNIEPTFFGSGGPVSIIEQPKE